MDLRRALVLTLMAAGCGAAEAPAGPAPPDGGATSADAARSMGAADAAAPADRGPLADDAAADHAPDAEPLDLGAVAAPDARPLEPGGPPADFVYPPLDSDAWPAATPESLGWDRARLEAAVAFVESHRSTAFMVVHRGRVVVERYWQGWDLHTSEVIASAAKSITAVLIGLMLEDGTLALDDAVSTHLGAGWSMAPPAEEARITIRHLLTMTSGLDDRRTPVSDPGTAWYYNTDAYYALGDIIGASSGSTRDVFTARRLAERIGLRDSRWRGRSMACSARDMARFGLLVLSRGWWDGARVVGRADYLEEALHPSQTHNPSYGYLWWLNGQSGYLLPGASPARHPGPLLPNGPADLVAALGAGDKKIYVVPSLELVVVRHGDAAAAPQQALSSFDDELWRLLSAAMAP